MHRSAIVLDPDPFSRTLRGIAAMTQSGLDSIQAEANDPGFAGPRRRAPKPGARSHSGLKRQDLENLNANGPILDQNLQDVSIDRELIRVLVADDHPILREGLVALINRQTGMKVVAEAADGSEAVALFSRFTPDVAVIDLRMPAMNGIETLTAIRMADPQARLVILTSFASDEDIYRALRAGARGYLVKDAPAEELVKCLRTVHEGGTFIPPAIASKLAERVGTAELTAREREVLALVAKGKANREIGSELDVTEGTIKVHVNNILNKLGVASRTEAVNLAVRRGLVRIDES